MYINIADPNNPVYPCDIPEQFNGVPTTLDQLAEANIYPVTQDETFNIPGYYRVTSTSDPYEDDDGNWKISVVTKEMHDDVSNILEGISAQKRKERDKLIEKQMWRYERHAREVRLGLTPTDDIAALDTYIQALADVPTQEGFPWEITWPVLEA